MCRPKLCGKELNTLVIFRVKKTDMMGFDISEQFYTKFAKAESAFEDMIEEYRNNENLVSKEDIEGKEPITVTNNPNRIKRVMISLWYRCSYESDEWDIAVESLELEKIEVKE